MSRRWLEDSARKIGVPPPHLSMPTRYADARNIVFHKDVVHSGSCLHEQDAFNEPRIYLFPDFTPPLSLILSRL